MSTSAQNETRDGFCPDDLPETSALQALQERTYGFSFWPKVIFFFKSFRCHFFCSKYHFFQPPSLPEQP